MRGACPKYALHLDKVRGRGCAHAKITTLACCGLKMTRCEAVRGEFSALKDGIFPVKIGFGALRQSNASSGAREHCGGLRPALSRGLVVPAVSDRARSAAAAEKISNEANEVTSPLLA